jgi:mannose-6-phosphate isomerase-like protein (cupin superfamily)
MDHRYDIKQRKDGDAEPTFPTIERQRVHGSKEVSLAAMLHAEIQLRRTFSSSARLICISRRAGAASYTIAIKVFNFTEKPMSGFSINIEQKTLAGNNFREVLYTTQRSQLVIMTLQAGEEIGMEHHEGHDQFIRVEAGEGVAILDGEEHKLEDGVAVVIPAGTEHNVINTSKTEPMRLYTLYTPPEHPEGIIHANKAEADEYERTHGH